MLQKLLGSWRTNKALKAFHNNCEAVSTFNDNSLKYYMGMDADNGKFTIRNKLTNAVVVALTEKEFQGFIEPFAECMYMDELVQFMSAKLYTENGMFSHDVYKKFITLQEEWEGMAHPLIDKLRNTDHIQQIEQAYEWLENEPPEIQNCFALDTKYIQIAEGEMTEAAYNYNQREYRLAEFNMMYEVYKEKYELIASINQLKEDLEICQD
jgi:hypothetical protein